ncbi:MAG: hypothetical protein ABFS19_14955 [Thermodesulfobacteriota bacterium]
MGNCYRTGVVAVIIGAALLLGSCSDKDRANRSMYKGFQSMDQMSDPAATPLPSETEERQSYDQYKRERQEALDENTP